MTRRSRSGYARADDDWYTEEAWAVEAILDRERFPGPLYDPACGGGQIPRLALDRGIEAYGSDLRRRTRSPYVFEADFLEPALWEDAILHHRGDTDIGSIVVNPPFKHARRFVERSLDLARYKVAAILPIAFLEGERRADFFEAHPPARVYVARNRVNMPPGGRSDIEAKGGTTVYAWFVWEVGARPRPPIIDWFEKPKAKGESTP